MAANEKCTANLAMSAHPSMYLVHKIPHISANEFAATWLVNCVRMMIDRMSMKLGQCTVPAFDVRKSPCIFHEVAATWLVNCEEWCSGFCQMTSAELDVLTIPRIFNDGVATWWVICLVPCYISPVSYVNFCSILSFPLYFLVFRFTYNRFPSFTVDRLYMSGRRWAV